MPEPQLEASERPTPSYGARYYETYTVPYERNDHWLAFFGNIADRIVQDFHPRTALDAGCATGILVEQLARRGVESTGFDISEYAIGKAEEFVPGRCRVGSLTEPIDGHYDLVTCIEVVEHLWPDDARRAIANLCAATDRVLFSSSPDDFREPSHVNLQPQEQWTVEFAAHGFYRNLDYDSSYLARWAALYERRDVGPGDVIREYDRAHCRLRDEIAELRAAIIDLDAKIQARGDVEAVLAEQAAIREEMLMMRDTIVGLQASLGESEGRASVLGAELAGKGAAVEQLQALLDSRTWRATLKLTAPYRRLRRTLGR